MLRFIQRKTCYSSIIITSIEMQRALIILIELAPSQTFKREIELIRKGQCLPKHFLKLSPFLDDQDVLRVGGRIVLSKLGYDQKHPALLPSSHRLTKLIIQFTHAHFLHPGVQTTQYLLLQQYWILSAKRIIRKILSRCLKCFKVHPQLPQPIMAPLPAVRVFQVKPFTHIGVDYAGPSQVTAARIRGSKLLKCYICVFICMTTKAIHLELASELTANTFLAVLRRLVSRRGRVSDLFSDRGTNFIGAYKEINTLMKQAVDSEGVTWDFNTPAAPNFGGLWEAGVKSVKTHIFRVVGNQTLTYEEFLTLLVQIESVLNYPLSSYPTDFNVLTPGHFLTMELRNSLPEHSLMDIKLGRLTRWQLV